MNINKIIQFVNPFYDNKDTMHNLSHIDRVLKLALELSSDYEGQINKDIIIYGEYFHGIIYSHEKDIKNFLMEEGFTIENINLIIQVSWESQKDKNAITLEGKILHDAHMIEGGKTFLIVKSLVTGTSRGQTLEETIKYLEDNILDKGRCYLPRSQKIYDEKQIFAREFVKDLKIGLRGELFE